MIAERVALALALVGSSALACGGGGPSTSSPPPPDVHRPPARASAAPLSSARAEVPAPPPDELLPPLHVYASGRCRMPLFREISTRPGPNSDYVVYILHCTPEGVPNGPALLIEQDVTTVLPRFGDGLDRLDPTSGAALGDAALAEVFWPGGLKLREAGSEGKASALYWYQWSSDAGCWVESSVKPALDPFHPVSPPLRFLAGGASRERAPEGAPCKERVVELARVDFRDLFAILGEECTAATTSDAHGLRLGELLVERHLPGTYSMRIERLPHAGRLARIDGRRARHGFDQYIGDDPTVWANIEDPTSGGSRPYAARLEGGAWVELPMPPGRTLEAYRVFERDALAVLDGRLYRMRGGTRGWAEIALPRSDRTGARYTAINAAFVERGDLLVSAHDGEMGVLLRTKAPDAVIQAEANPPEVAACPCRDPYVRLFTVPGSSPRDVAFPGTASALSAEPALLRGLTLAEAEENGRRTLVAFVRSWPVGERVAEAVAKAVPGAQPKVMCDRPKKVRRSIPIGP